jgi:hypothetical protein
VAQPFYAKLKERAAAIRIGDPLQPGCRLGPVVSEGQYKRVMSYVQVGSIWGEERGRAGRCHRLCMSRVQAGQEGAGRGRQGGHCLGRRVRRWACAAHIEGMHKDVVPQSQ